jgi:hypothetical protein
MKWLVSDTSTRAPTARFKTKKAAMHWGRCFCSGLFFVWKEKS